MSGLDKIQVPRWVPFNFDLWIQDPAAILETDKGFLVGVRRVEEAHKTLIVALPLGGVIREFSIKTGSASICYTSGKEEYSAGDVILSNPEHPSHMGHTPAKGELETFVRNYLLHLNYLVDDTAPDVIQQIASRLKSLALGEFFDFELGGYI